MYVVLGCVTSSTKMVFFGTEEEWSSSSNIRRFQQLIDGWLAVLIALGGDKSTMVCLVPRQN